MQCSVIHCRENGTLCRTSAALNSHGPGIQCSGCPAERAIFPAMYDRTLHIDGLVVCSLLRNAKMTAALCYLAQVQCRRKWLKDLPAAISGCNIASALFTNYCVLCMVCDTSRALWPGCP